jgi:hypothetical protein
MASTISLNSTIQWARPFLFFKPLAFASSGNEPAISSANLVQQTILGPPFRWNWNRKSLTFVTTPGVQDYPVTLADFGFMEKASVAIQGSKTIEIEIYNNNSLGEDTVAARPRFISAQLDDNSTAASANITNVSLSNNILTVTAINSFVAGQVVYFTGLTNATFLNGQTAEVITSNGTSFTAVYIGPDYSSPYGDTGTASEGNITFRLMPVPEQVYTITVQYQKKVPLFNSLSEFWVVPDNYSYIYQLGFMSFMMQFSDDPRWQLYAQKFVSHLLAAQDGLTATERNIFLNSWGALIGNAMTNTMDRQQDAQAKGNL